MGNPLGIPPGGKAHHAVPPSETSKQTTPEQEVARKTLQQVQGGVTAAAFPENISTTAPPSSEKVQDVFNKQGQPKRPEHLKIYSNKAEAEGALAKSSPPSFILRESSSLPGHTILCLKLDSRVENIDLDSEGTLPLASQESDQALAIKVMHHIDIRSAKNLVAAEILPDSKSVDEVMKNAAVFSYCFRQSATDPRKTIYCVKGPNGVVQQTNLDHKKVDEKLFCRNLPVEQQRNEIVRSNLMFVLQFAESWVQCFGVTSRVTPTEQPAVEQPAAPPQASPARPEELTSQEREQAYPALKSASGLKMPQEHLLQIVDFIIKNRHLISGGEIGEKASKPGIIKIKADKYPVPYNLEYNTANGDVVVKMGYLNKGACKTIKQGLLLSATQFSMIARGKQNLYQATESVVQSARNERKMFEHIKANAPGGKAPHVIQLREFKEYRSHKKRANVIHTSYPLYNMGDLADSLKKNKFTVKEKLQIALDILQGIKELHDLGILHRDLKPANVFVHRTIEGGKAVVHAFVGDLGFACLERDETSRKQHLGSPLYMHPSVLEAERFGEENDYPDKPGDVWGAGLILAAIFQEELKDKDFFNKIPSEDKLGKSLTDKADIVGLGMRLGEYPPPGNKDSINYVIWRMLRPNRNEQIGLGVAISKIEDLIKRL